MTLPGVPSAEGDLRAIVAQLRRDVDALRNAAPARIAVTDASWRLLNADGNEIVVMSDRGGSFTRPDGTPQTVFSVKDDEGRTRIQVYDPFPDGADGYSQEVVIWSTDDNTVLRTNAAGGLREPRLSVALYQMWRDSRTVDAVGQWAHIPASVLTAGSGDGQLLWEGRIGRVVHTHLSVSGIWGRFSGASASTTYKIKVAGTVRGTWVAGALEVSRQEFDLSAHLGTTGVGVQILAQATGTGTDRVSAQILGCWGHAPDT